MSISKKMKNDKYEGPELYPIGTDCANAAHGIKAANKNKVFFISYKV